LPPDDAVDDFSDTVDRGLPLPDREAARPPPFRAQISSAPAVSSGTPWSIEAHPVQTGPPPVPAQQAAAPAPRVTFLAEKRGWRLIVLVMILLLLVGFAAVTWWLSPGYS
jgi:hypothetical protein